MSSRELLKNCRDLLLKLHKSLLDGEREAFESLHGPLKPTEYLSILLENEDFAWLRRFSMLIVEIDELFAQKDGIESGMIEANLKKVRELVEISGGDETFRTKYQVALQRDVEAASLQSEIKGLLK